MDLVRGQLVLIHYATGTVHKDRIKRVFKNGRFELRGTICSWYIEEGSLARMWNKPDHVRSDMVAEIVAAL